MRNGHQTLLLKEKPNNVDVIGTRKKNSEKAILKKRNRKMSTPLKRKTKKKINLGRKKKKKTNTKMSTKKRHLIRKKKIFRGPYDWIINLSRNLRE